MKTKHLTLSAVFLLTVSTMAFAGGYDQDMESRAGIANLGLDPLAGLMADNSQGPQAGQRYTLTRETTFTIVKNNVPVEHNPNAKQAGETITLPENTVLDILGTSVTPNVGATIRLAPDEPGNNTAIPSDFEVSAADFMAASAHLENIALLDMQIEDQAASMSVQQAMNLDQENQAMTEYFTSEARNGRSGGGLRGSGGGHRAGMTYCLQNVEVKAAALGICPYKISEGYARKSLQGFVSICHMNPTSYSSDLPMGSICISHGTNHHFCDGAPCGDAKMKTGNGWYNGVGSGYSIEAGIGPIIGCATPSGSVRTASADSRTTSKAPVRRKLRRRTVRR